MLRCGQMILGEALMCRHLGRGTWKQVCSPHWTKPTAGLTLIFVALDWRWTKGQKDREEYTSILNAFIDKKDSYYSIHQIGQWPKHTIR